VYAFDSNTKNLFAFVYKGEYPVNGWEVYDDIKEWKRMGINFESKVSLLVMIVSAFEIMY